LSANLHVFHAVEMHAVCLSVLKGMVARKTHHFTIFTMVFKNLDLIDWQQSTYGFTQDKTNSHKIVQKC